MDTKKLEGHRELGDSETARKTHGPANTAKSSDVFMGHDIRYYTGIKNLVRGQKNNTHTHTLMRRTLIKRGFTGKLGNSKPRSLSVVTGLLTYFFTLVNNWFPID